eukprot:358989-Chlamydomonas_euryale.AAC.6
MTARVSGMDPSLVSSKLQCKPPSERETERSFWGSHPTQADTRAGEARRRRQARGAVTAVIAGGHRAHSKCKVAAGTQLSSLDRYTTETSLRVLSCRGPATAARTLLELPGPDTAHTRGCAGTQRRTDKLTQPGALGVRCAMPHATCMGAASVHGHVAVVYGHSTVGPHKMARRSAVKAATAAGHSILGWLAAPSLSAVPSQPSVCTAAMPEASSSRSGGPSTSQPLITCRRCKQRFVADSNASTSCQYHPAIYTGGEVAKAMGFVRR